MSSSMFERENVKYDLPTIEIVPEDEAERRAWERRRKLAEARRAVVREENRRRKENLEQFERDEKRLVRRFLRWIGL